MVSGTLRSFLDILDNLELKYDYKTNRVEDKCYGKHNIVLKNKVEEIVISHTVLDRGLFLEGILQSMDYISNKKSGLFTYEDIIYGLS